MSGKGSKARFANGIIAAVLVAFFLVHAALGSLSGLTGFKSPLSWVVWVGIALVVVHIAVSVVTSIEQLNDAEHPPSARKKRHLALKWATGALLVVSVIAHIASMRMWGAETVQASATGAALTIVLAIVLSWHICVGIKSMLVDVGMSKALITPLRIAVIALAVAFVVMAIAAIVL